MGSDGQIGLSAQNYYVTVAVANCAVTGPLGRATIQVLHILNSGLNLQGRALLGRQPQLNPVHVVGVLSLLVETPEHHYLVVNYAC